MTSAWLMFYVWCGYNWMLWFVAAADGPSLADYVSIISEVFEGRLINSIQCVSCRKVSTRTEPFTGLSVPITSDNRVYHINTRLTCNSVVLHKDQPHSCVFVSRCWLWSIICRIFRWIWQRHITLADCLSSYFSAEQLIDDNAYRCDYCNSLSVGVKVSKICRLPEILCIYLKRFHQFSDGCKKLTDYVEFPLHDLDMSPYLHSETADQAVYDLMSVICHKGTAQGGHYVTYALNDMDHSWYAFNDTVVVPVAEQTVSSCEAYMLFYRKKKTVRYRLPECTDKTSCCYISRQWMHKLETFSSPGPVDNHDILCPHGAIHPRDWNCISDLVQAVSPASWKLIKNRFGGGPELRYLHQCPSCLHTYEALARRQCREMNAFITMNGELNCGENVYAVSAQWFHTWQQFVHGETEDIPGPIDNQPLVHTQCQLIPSTDYTLLSPAMWQFLHAIYGGGPAVELPSDLVHSDSSITTQ